MPYVRIPGRYRIGDNRLVRHPRRVAVPSDPCPNMVPVAGVDADFENFTEDFDSTPIDSNWFGANSLNVSAGVYNLSNFDNLQRYNKAHLSELDHFKIEVDVGMSTIPVQPATFAFTMRCADFTRQGGLSGYAGTYRQFGIRDKASSPFAEWFLFESGVVDWSQDFAGTGRLGWEFTFVEVLPANLGILYHVKYLLDGVTVFASDTILGSCYHNFLAGMSGDGMATLDDYSFTVL